VLYDIRGVFDGSIIKEGINGNPTIIYTSTFTGPLGATSDPPEQEGTETQSFGEY
jgi:beta-fructofuranosidase